MSYYMITFSNTHTAIAAQKFLTGKIDFCIMPTLREISHSCGISIRINTSLCDKSCGYTTSQAPHPLLQLMAQASIPSHMYHIYFVSDDTIKLLPLNQT